MEKKEVVNKMIKVIEEIFNEGQKKPYQYVVAYYKVADDTLIGYHLSTFCQVTDNKLKAKRYNGDNPYSQLSVIKKNVDNTLAITEENAKDQFLGSVTLDIKNTHFPNMSAEDVYIVAEYLDEGIPPQKFTHQIIDNEKQEKNNT